LIVFDVRISAPRHHKVWNYFDQNGITFDQMNQVKLSIIMSPVLHNEKSQEIQTHKPSLLTSWMRKDSFPSLHSRLSTYLTAKSSQDECFL